MSDERLKATIRRIVRTPRDVADYMICEFESETGLTASKEDRAEALREAYRMAGVPDDRRTEDA